MAQVIQLSSRRQRRKMPRDFRPALARQAALARRDPVALAAPALPPMPGTARSSQINPDYPVFGTPTTVTVRNNFQAAKDEIEELQNDKLDLAGGVMIGPITFAPNQLIDGGIF